MSLKTVLCRIRSFNIYILFFPSMFLFYSIIYFALVPSFFLASWEYRRKRARKISTHTHLWIDESPSTPGFLFHGGPRTESWVQCLLDESFPSTSPRNHHHRFSQSLLSPPRVHFSSLLPSSYLSLPNSDPRIISSRTDYFLKDDTYPPKRFQFSAGRAVEIISK